MYMWVFFLGKVTALGVLCCFALFVCLTLLASFFLSSSLKHVHVYMYVYKVHVHVYVVTVTSDLQYLVIKPTCKGSGCSVLSIARELYKCSRRVTKYRWTESLACLGYV